MTRFIGSNVAPAFHPSPSERRFFGNDNTQPTVASQIINPNTTHNFQNIKARF